MIFKKPKFSPLTIVIFSCIFVLIGFCLGFLAGYYNPKTRPLKEQGDPTIAELLIKEIQPDNIRRHLTWLTTSPHMSGTAGEKAVVDYISNYWKEVGLNPVKIIPYEVLLSFPNMSNPNRIKILDAMKRTLFSTKAVEEALRPEQNASTIVPPFSAYSAKGTAEGHLVFVNYGRVEDFENLSKQSINVSGCICISRYGKIFRGNKAALAERHGCSGLILYSDPADYAIHGTEKVYPNSWWLPGSGIQRGSLKLSLGDPLSPLYPATKFAYRMDTSSAHLPRIPVQPIGYDDAMVLMKNMTGPEATPMWKGKLNIPYRLGPGYLQEDVRVRMDISTYSQLATTYNVIGFIEGREEPDRYVILGNHHDAWVFGAVDPSSGTAVMLEVARAFGKMVSNGWRPRRTIVFCAWGAEEHGLIGSREWVENFGHILGHRAVAYLNVDLAIAGNYSLRGRSLPLLRNLLYEVTKGIPNPDADEVRQGRTTVYDTWLDRLPGKNTWGNLTGKPNVPLLGSGSDFDPFISAVGVTSLDIRYNFDESTKLSSYPLYHSAYETMHLVDTFIDPTFKVSTAVGQVWAELARRLADYIILPFSASDYAESLKEHLESFEKVNGLLLSVNKILLGDLKQAVVNFTVAATEFEESVSKVDKSNALAIRRINDQMVQLEKNFIDPPGILDRRGQRHVIYAPSAHDMYAGSAFPGLVDSLFQIERIREEGERTRRWNEVRKQISILIFFIDSAASSLKPPTEF